MLCWFSRLSVQILTIKVKFFIGIKINDRTCINLYQNRLIIKKDKRIKKRFKKYLIRDKPYFINGSLIFVRFCNYQRLTDETNTLSE